MEKRSSSSDRAAAAAITTVASFALACVLCGCSRSVLEPTQTTPTGAGSPAPSPAPSETTTLWSADSTVLSVSGQNSCLADNAVGDITTNVGWTITNSATFITLIEAIGAYDVRTPYYEGSLSGNQFRTKTAQDGGDCLPENGDFSGSFSADGLTFDAIENIEYRDRGGNLMQVRRHWTGSRR
jgi:hypothetical protein